MAALANILPLTFLGTFCFLVLVLLAFYCWKRTFPQQANAELENPDYEVEEIPGTTDFVMVGRRGQRKRKIKKPKLWDVWVSNFGARPAHERKPSSGSSISDLSSSEDVGHWAELKVGTSSPITSTRCSVLIFVFLAHVCHLCQKPKQDHTTHSYTICPLISGPNSRPHSNHSGRQRSHERPTELVAILALATPFSRYSTASHPRTPTSRKPRRRDRRQDVQARQTREYGCIRQIYNRGGPGVRLDFYAATTDPHQ